MIIHRVTSRLVNVTIDFHKEAASLENCSNEKRS